MSHHELFRILLNHVLLLLQLLHIPRRPEEPSFDEIGLGTAEPDGEVSRKLSCIGLLAGLQISDFCHLRES